MCRVLEALHLLGLCPEVGDAVPDEKDERERPGAGHGRGGHVADSHRNLSLAHLPPELRHHRLGQFDSRNRNAACCQRDPDPAGADRELQRRAVLSQALKEIEYQLRRIGRNVNQIAHNANREMNATIEDEASASYAVRQCRELIDHLDTVIERSGND